MSDEAFESWEPRRPLIIDPCPTCGYDLRHHEIGECESDPTPSKED